MKQLTLDVLQCTVIPVLLVGGQIYDSCRERTGENLPHRPLVAQVPYPDSLEFVSCAEVGYHKVHVVYDGVLRGNSFGLKENNTIFNRLIFKALSTHKDGVPLETDSVLRCGSQRQEDE